MKQLFQFLNDNSPSDRQFVRKAIDRCLDAADRGHTLYYTNAATGHHIDLLDTVFSRLGVEAEIVHRELPLTSIIVRLRVAYNPDWRSDHGLA